MNQKKILIIEDELDVAAYLESLFQDGGYGTIIANDGLAGYEMAKSEKPDLITLDITMPVRSGFRTYRHFKEDPELGNIPIVFITAVSDSLDGLAPEFKGLPGPQGFMSKPLIPERLLQMIKTILNPEARRSNSLKGK